MVISYMTKLHPQEFKPIDLPRIRERLASQIAESYRNKNNVLIESLPITGKSHSTFKQAQETDTQILYLTSLNRLKEDSIKKCNEFGLSYHKIPVPHDECPSFQNDKHGLRELYRRGISAKELHERLELPCNGSCPYIESLNRDLSDIDVLIGNPKHAYNPNYLTNRVAVKDEFSENEYELVYHKPRELINRFIHSVNSFPLNSFTEIREASQEETAKVVNWFQEFDVYRDTETALDPEEYHVHAPLLAYALLVGIEVNPGWEKTHTQFSEIDGIDTHIGDNAQVVFDEKRESMYLLNPPDFESADGFIGLDGTPIPEMWDCATGLNLEHIQVLSEEEKKRYITDILNLEIKQVSEHKRYYQNSNNIAVNQDTSLAYSIQQKEGEKPGVITSKKAIQKYDDEIEEYTDNSLNFARILSSNKFQDKQLGFVTGMRNYGDEYVFKWGSYLGKSVQVDREGETEYQFGNETFNIFPLYRNLTLQDVFRFGRSKEPTTVYVNTSGLPNWVPVQKEELQSHSPSKLAVIRYLRESDEQHSQKEIEKATGYSQKQISRVLNQLESIKKYNSSGAFFPDKYEWCGN
ncbi:MarR family transcriptional regulator [Halorubrum halophilum]|uniref:MarR family transcriptional regulator n=1 Tax=Halorubrum halophilum TaxID=413816 RepID=UPI000A727B7A|nr:MarR family transcriptional regulator [Halorubrum halophilum]